MSAVSDRIRKPAPYRKCTPSGPMMSPYAVVMCRDLMRSETLWFAIVCMIVFGFSRGCSDSNMMPILCQVAEPQHRATGYGVLNFFSCCIGGVATYLGGWLREHQVDVSLLLMGSGVLVLVSALLLIVVKPVRS